MRGGSNVLLTPAQTAERLGVSRKTVDRNWRLWELPRVVLSARAVRFRERDVENFIERRTFEV